MCMTANMQVAAVAEIPAEYRLAVAAQAVKELAGLIHEYRSRLEKVAAARAQVALALYRQGFTYEELTRVFGVTRTVTARLLARGREDEREMSPDELATVTAISSAALSAALIERTAS